MTKVVGEQSGAKSRSVVNRAITWVLTHRLSLAVKRPMRNVLWAFKGERLVNPVLPAKVESILFVCLGNICRSPFAEALAVQRLGELRVRDFRCASAGIKTHQGGRAPQNACDVAATFGLSLTSHRPQTLTADLMNAYDLVVVMEASQLDEVRRVYPQASARLFLLSLFDRAATGYERYNIADPFSQPRKTFEMCYERIDRAVTQLLLDIDRRAGEA